MLNIDSDDLHSGVNVYHITLVTFKQNSISIELLNRTTLVLSNKTLEDFRALQRQIREARNPMRVTE
jgi:hypothetical protein